MNKDMKEMMAQVADANDEALRMIYGRPMGFALLIFEFNKQGMSSYISNGQMSDVINALREAADKLESGEIMPPHIGTA